jgi:hypothetical protein
VCFPKLYISLPSFFFFLRSFTNYLFEKERRIETLESHHRPSPIFLYIPFFFLYLFKKKIRRKEKSLTALVFICWPAPGNLNANGYGPATSSFSSSASIPPPSLSTFLP